MKPKKINHNKIKNTGVIFEMLVRQVTSDTMSGKKESSAIELIKRYFNPKTEMGKELQLYRAFFESSRLTENRALHFLDLILQQRKKLDDKKLAREKYNLIKEIKDIYPLKDFMSCKIPDYTIHASIYKTFISETVSDPNVDIINIQDVATARFTLIEYLSTPPTKKPVAKQNEALKEFCEQSEDVRLLSYKFLVDKFNQQYNNLNDGQKSLLRQYINNSPDGSSLMEYVRKEVPQIQSTLRSRIKDVTDKVTQIKLNEVVMQLDTIGKKRTVKDSEVTALMVVYEILKEISE
jgi:hypothetical protein